MFALISLLAVGCYWVAVTASKETGVSATPLPTPALDAAAQFIQRCGRPDVDSIAPAKLQPRAPERWSLLYRSAKIRAVFEREASEPSTGWKNVKYFDPTSGKQLNSHQVLTRLPCAVRNPP